MVLQVVFWVSNICAVKLNFDIFYLSRVVRCATSHLQVGINKKLTGTVSNYKLVHIYGRDKAYDESCIGCECKIEPVIAKGVAVIQFRWSIDRTDDYNRADQYCYLYSM